MRQSAHSGKNWTSCEFEVLQGHIFGLHRTPTQKNRKLHSSRGNGKDVNCQLLAGLPDVFKNLLTHANLGGNGLLFVQ